MKIKIFLAAALITLFVQGFAQDNTKTAPSPLLLSYYNLKDALVGSDANAAAIYALEFVKAVKDADKETVNEDNRSALLKDAAVISESKDLRVQREKFATLSASLYALAKSVKLSKEPVYLQYCPMKKASWLSDNKAIKNPFYGSAMLTCGSVKETL